MKSTEDFIKEIEVYSIEELELIYETQKDLYTKDEMDLIIEQIELYKRKEKEQIELQKEKEKKKIEHLLPKEITCPKCDGPNSFENDECIFCGAVLEKEKYYDVNYYENQAKIQEYNGESNTFRHVVSFLIPIIGYILGAILLAKDDPYEKSTGKTCIILGIVSTILSTLVWFAFASSIY